MNIRAGRTSLCPYVQPAMAIRKERGGFGMHTVQISSNSYYTHRFSEKHIFGQKHQCPFFFQYIVSQKRYVGNSAKPTITAAPAFPDTKKWKSTARKKVDAPTNRTVQMLREEEAKLKTASALGAKRALSSFVFPELPIPTIRSSLLPKIKKNCHACGGPWSVSSATVCEQSAAKGTTSAEYDKFMKRYIWIWRCEIRLSWLILVG